MDISPSKEELIRKIKKLEKQLLHYRQAQKNPVAIENSDSRLYDMVETLKEVIYATDEKGAVTYVSPNIEAVSGYRREDVVGRLFLDFVHPEDLPKRMEQFYNILKGESSASEYKFVNKDNRVVWVRTDARQIVVDGVVVGVQGVLVDITKRKKAELALKESEEKYRILFENAKDAIFVTQDGVVKFTNPTAADFLGHNREKLRQTPFLNFLHPDDRQTIQDRHERRIRGKNVSDTVSFRVINSEGEEKAVDLNAVLIVWEGRPAVLNFLRDLTPQKQLEARLHRAQRLEAIGTLAGGIAHNFNNLLMGIQGNASQILRKFSDAGGGSDQLQKILDLVQSGSELTDQLLGYARGGRYEVQAVDLNRLLNTVVETVAAAKKDIRINLNLSKDLDEIEAERGQIEQVIYNLLVNAAEAMPRGGSIIVETIGASRDDLLKSTLNQAEGKYVRLVIADSGTGMIPEVQEHIFEPFFSTKNMGEGTGLGLSSAYGIVKGHGGAIEVESQPGKGSVFTIFLPASTKKQESARPAVPREVKAGKRVLVVDDEKMVLEVTGELLEALGFTVTSCDNGKDAVRFLGENKNLVDLVLLDLTMPGMGGAETFDRIRQIDPDVNILLCSGYGRDSQAEKLLGRGCAGFIQKPYDLGELSNKINQILSAECR